jgi:arylsulfatase A
MSRFFLLLLCFGFSAAAAPAPSPNIVLIFCDDLGYGDIGPYRSDNPTPNLDRMAREGVRFTDFYVAQAVCSASRAALMTGRYPNRVGILGALGPRATNGISASELTMAEMLKARGYATALFGKWHLGHLPQFLPTRHGFDQYYGLPYSNDMWPKHPSSKFPDLPLIEGEKVIELNPDQRKLTRDYTERAVKFIADNRRKPFFLYLAHSMPHVPLFASERFEGRTKAGLYADVIAEIDWSVGEVLNALRKHKLDENTLVIFTSDNGPWLSYGNHAGSATHLREGKATTFEGGVRVPFLARWPGRIRPATTCAEPAMTIDLLPTFARLTAATPPQGLDGKDIWPLLAGEAGAKSPHEAFFFYWNRQLQAVRSGPWKLHFVHDYPTPERPGADGQPAKMTTKKIEEELFDLREDPGETTPVKDSNIVKRIVRLADQCRKDLGDVAPPPPRKEFDPKLFAVPSKYTNASSKYPPPLVFNDGSRVTENGQWTRRRQEILDFWHTTLGPWPPLLEKPKLEIRETTYRNSLKQLKVRVEVAPNQFTDGIMLLPLPEGEGQRGGRKFPAVFVPYYEPETSTGLSDQTNRDFGYQLARRGFITLSIGSPGGDSRKPELGEARCQPLSFLAYVAANCHTVLAQLPEVDPKRIGVVGHSYGSKWSMFASCLYEKFACAAWCDGGIVFDETRSNVNYWEPWYIGWDKALEAQRKPGVIKSDNPRTGPYKTLIETGHDLHELHALMPPRPFFVSGGSEDPKERWEALQSTVAINQLLGQTNRVAMHNRPGHTPTPESNDHIYSFFEHVLKP